MNREAVSVEKQESLQTVEQVEQFVGALKGEGMSVELSEYEPRQAEVNAEARESIPSYVMPQVERAVKNCEAYLCCSRIHDPLSGVLYEERVARRDYIAKTYGTACRDFYLQSKYRRNKLSYVWSSLAGLVTSLENVTNDSPFLKRLHDIALEASDFPKGYSSFSDAEKAEVVRKTEQLAFRFIELVCDPEVELMAT